MRKLPTGTVTLLFSDIEGSTRLLYETGDAYAELLAEHRSLLRAAFSAHGGVEVDTQGDGFFYAFASAPDAVAAAEAAQEAVTSGPVQVRMGLHTGSPRVVDEGYVGTDVHRAARIASAAHGGQVVLSLSTRVLLGDAVGILDLGEHRLKDLTAPERIFQLGERRFPPIRSLHRTNLPVPPTPFLGREGELAEAVNLLRREDLRLLVFTGPGGTGKTRLALQAAAQVADDFPDGVWWVSLAPLRDPTLVVSAIAQTLGVHEQEGGSLEESLTASIAGKRLLLLLDNAEHLLPDLARTVAKLRDVPGPTLLVTSRERLRLHGEHTVAVPSLSESDGANLFYARARAAGSTFGETPAVAAICRRLDGLPLALELAAARTTVFSPEQLLERLGKRLDLLRGGRDADPRQETLRATITWSCDLLDEVERSLFRQLSIFVGGCTYEAAEEVAGATPDTLQSLIDKSLLHLREAGASSRYWMLETIREFAQDELRASSERETIRRRHLAWALALAKRAEDERRSGRESSWLDLVAAEHGNLRAALNCAVEQREPLSALGIVGAIWAFWDGRAHSSDPAGAPGVLAGGADRSAPPSLVKDFSLAIELFEASVDMAAARVAGASGVSLPQGDPQSASPGGAAGQPSRRTRETAHELGLRDALVLGLFELAVTVEPQEPRRAARLLGQMQSLVEQGQELPEAERPTEPRAQPLLRVLRERLGEGRLAAELASGGMLTIEEALREALEP